MRRMVMAAAALACGAGWASGAQAQGRAAPRTHSSEEERLPPSVPPAISTLAPVRGVSGLRLQPGAVLCGSEGDLHARAEVNRRRADGDPDAGDPLSGCRLLGQQRGVEVLSRAGLGAVQVKLKPSGEVGWTDSYLR